MCADKGGQSGLLSKYVKRPKIVSFSFRWLKCHSSSLHELFFCDLYDFLAFHFTVLNTVSIRVFTSAFMVVHL